MTLTVSLTETKETVGAVLCRLERLGIIDF